jgi:hypothetical protein
MGARAIVSVAAGLTALMLSCPAVLANGEKAAGVRVWYPPAAEVEAGPPAPIIHQTQIVQQKVVIVFRRGYRRTGAWGPRYPFSTALGPLYPF